MHQAKTKAALIKKAILEKRKDKWQEKPQHGAFLRQLGEIGADMKESFGWLTKCFIDPASEGYIFAAQEMALFTKFHERYILFTISSLGVIALLSGNILPDITQCANTCTL